MYIYFYKINCLLFLNNYKIKQKSINTTILKNICFNFEMNNNYQKNNLYIFFLDLIIFGYINKQFIKLC